VEPNTSEAACRKIIEPYHDAVWGVLAWAVREFNRIPEELRLPLLTLKRSLYTSIHAYAMVAVRRDLTGSGIQLRWDYETVELYFGSNVVARLKKMDDEGFTSNVPTARVEAFHGGGNYELFAEMWAAPLRVDIGYQLNPTATALARVSVVRRKSPMEIDWRYDILPPATPTALPLPAPKPLPAIGGRRVQSRRAQPEPETKKNGAG
jgi:hypothetical protein